MGIGRKIRLSDIIDRNTGKTVIVPMDHGISVGPIDGLINVSETINSVAEGGANAIVEHKGLVEDGFRRKGKSISLIIHLSGSSGLAENPDAKVLITSVTEALKLGANGVSIHVNLGNGAEKDMLRDFGSVARECEEWGIPLMAMIYPRPAPTERNKLNQAIAHAARIGAEVGADIVKVSYTGDEESFRRVTEGCRVPVVIAGGPKMNTDIEVLETVKGAMNAGACGTSIGRNIFQHQDPRAMTLAITSIVHEGATAEEANAIIHREMSRKK